MLEQNLRGSDRSWCILHSHSKTAEPSLVESMNFSEGEKQWLFMYLAQTADLHNIHYNHVSTQGYWSVDVLRSPVIEFTGCYFDGDIPRRGRLYYVDGFYGSEDLWKEKPEPFRRWARSVLSKTKRSLKRSNSDYIGKDAAAWVDSGLGKLVNEFGTLVNAHCAH